MDPQRAENGTNPAEKPDKPRSCPGLDRPGPCGSQENGFMVKPEEKLERNPGGGSELGARDNKAIRPGASCSDPPQPPPPSRCSLTGGGQKLRGGAASRGSGPERSGGSAGRTGGSGLRQAGGRTGTFFVLLLLLLRVTSTKARTT